MIQFKNGLYEIINLKSSYLYKVKKTHFDVCVHIYAIDA